MSMRKTCSRVQSFPSPESEAALSNKYDQSFVPKLEDLHQHQGGPISAERLSKILDASMTSQKMCMKLAIDSISSTTGSNSDSKFINCYLDSTVLLLDACNNIQLRLESIRTCLVSIPIGLHYLEGEQEPSRAVLQRAAAALESSRLTDRLYLNKMEKCVSGMRTVCKKLGGHTLAYEATSGSISRELYEALSSSWSTAALAIGMLGSATSLECVQPPKAETWTILFNELSKKMKVFRNKTDRTTTASMEELAAANLAAQTLLQLISAWQNGGSCSLRRKAVKAVGGELRRKRDELEKTLPLLEEKIGELYRQIVALRIVMLGLLSKVQKDEDKLEMVMKPSSCGERQRDSNFEQFQGGVTSIKAKTNRARRASSLG